MQAGVYAATLRTRRIMLPLRFEASDGSALHMSTGLMCPWLFVWPLVEVARARGGERDQQDDDIEGPWLSPLERI